VIFADANILSYRADLSDPGPAGLNTVRRAGPQGDVGRPGGPERATMATSDACPADNAGNPSSDRESTITLFFTADSGVNRVSREYTLWRQVNDSAPVATVHHVLRDGRLPFLEYRYVVPTEGGADTLATVPRALLPISRRDTVSSVVDVRALRAVEWHFLVPLDSASHPRIARVHLVTSLPGISQLDRHECREVSRDPPLLAQRESDGSDDVSPHQPRARPPAIG